MEGTAFDNWAAQAQLLNTQPLQEIGHQSEGPCIGVDALYFLEELHYPQKESLAPALGGFSPLIENHIIKAIKDLESAGCKVYFFFNGLDTVFDEHLSVTSPISSVKTARAFQLYNHGRISSTPDPLQPSAISDSKWLCAALKTALHKHGIPFVVAPFKAWAQMVHALNEGAVDALYGPSDLFLYGAPSIITKIRLQYDSPKVEDGKPNVQTDLVFNVEQSKVTWLELEQCQKMLGDIPLEVFLDAMFLVGTRSLEPFPPQRELLDPHNSFKEVTASLNQIGGNIIQHCERYPPAIRGNWLDRYMRANQAVKHMIVLYDYDTVKPRTYRNKERIDRPPSDIHELIGLQLPAELYHYLYHGLIGPRVLNWLIGGKINLPAPRAGGDGEIYRKLVREQLDPWRKQALALLAFTLSHYWQRKEFTTHSWYGQEFDQKFNMKDLTSEKQKISTWRVKDSVSKDRLKAIQATNSKISLGSLQFAVSSLKDSSFTSKTSSPPKRPSTEPQLQSSEEIVSNVIWRLLQLRGYVNEKHELTDWGKFLQIALEQTGSSNELAQSMFLVVELARLGLLDKAQVFAKETGGVPKSGSESDQANASIISHVACTGKLAYPQTGLSVSSNGQLLLYHSLITEIRLALRDLVEMILATMFLDDEVERIRDDLLDIAAALPFQEQWSAGLAIITAAYLEECAATESTDRGGKETITKKLADTFPQIKVADSIKQTTALWDAFTAAVDSAPSGLLRAEQKSLWTGTNAWFKTRRLD